MQHPVTIFPQLSASKKLEKNLQLKHLYEPRVWPDKKSMPLIAMAKFGDERTERNSLRHDANVITTYGVPLDYDNNDGLDFPFEQACLLLSRLNIKAWLYTSPSHTAEHPRWRVLLFFSVPYTDTTEQMKRRHKAAVHVVEEALGVEFASESKRLSQSYYIGRAETAELYDWHETTGTQHIDEYEDLDALGFLLSGNGVDHSDDKLDTSIAIDSIGLGADLHDNILRLTAHYAKYSLPREEIIQLVQDYMENSDSPNDARYQQRYDSIGRLTDGAIRKLESGEWDKLDPQGKPTKPKKKKKGKLITLEGMRSDYLLTPTDLADIDETEFIYKEIFRGPQMVAIVGPPSAGKTTVMEHIAAGMAKTHTVIYINADISSGDMPAAHRRAAAGGYELWCPDIKRGKSMKSIVDDITTLTEQGTDLTGYIFIFDTLKKMTEVINKSNARECYAMLRKLTAICHANVFCLAHTNKYGHDDWPMYEGTADLRSDFDALGLLFPLKGDYNQITTSLYWGQDDDVPWGKTRGRVDHAAWSMDTDRDGNRTVDQVRWIDTFSLAKDAAATKRVEDVNIAIANVVNNFEGAPTQGDICKLSGHPERITKKALKMGLGKYWSVEVGEHNANRHFLSESGLELIDISTAEGDFEQLLQ